MIDNENLEAKAAVGVTAAMLVVVSLISVYILYALLKNLKYPAAQLYLISIYLMPVLLGWTAWIQLLKSSELRGIRYLLNLFKAICLFSFLKYTEKMLGCVKSNELDCFSHEKMLENLCSPSISPRCLCMKCKTLESPSAAYSYLIKIRIAVYQLCIILVLLGVIGISIAIATDDYKLENSLVLTVLSTISSICTIIALIGLLNFGIFVNKLPSMRYLNIMHKFLIIKLGLLFTEIQPQIIQIFASNDLIASTSKYSAEEITIYTNSLMLVSEMIIMSFLLILIFPQSDYDKLSELQTRLETKIS